MASGRTTLEELCWKVQIPKESLDQECTREDVLELAKYCEKWKELAHHLKLDRHISEIDRDNQSERDKKRALLIQWKQALAFKATFRILIEAFLACENALYAQEIMEYIASKSNTTNTYILILSSTYNYTHSYRESIRKRCCF